MDPLIKVLRFNSDDRVFVAERELSVGATAANTRWAFVPFEVFSLLDEWVPTPLDYRPVTYSATFSGGNVYANTTYERVTRGTAGTYQLLRDDRPERTVLVYINRALNIYVGKRRSYAIRFPVGIDPSEYKSAGIVWLRLLLNSEYLPVRSFGLKLLQRDVTNLRIVLAEEYASRPPGTTSIKFDDALTRLKKKAAPDEYDRISKFSTHFLQLATYGLIAPGVGDVAFDVPVDGILYKYVEKAAAPFSAAVSYRKWDRVNTALVDNNLEAMPLLQQYNDDMQPVSTDFNFVFDPSEFAPTQSSSAMYGSIGAAAQSFVFVAMPANRAVVLAMYELHFLPELTVYVDSAQSSTRLYNDFFNVPLQFRSDMFEDANDVQAEEQTRDSMWAALVVTGADATAGSTAITSTQNKVSPAALMMFAEFNQSAIELARLKSVLKTDNVQLFLFESISDAVFSSALGTKFRAKDLTAFWSTDASLETVVQAVTVPKDNNMSLPYLSSDVIPLRRLVAVFAVTNSARLQRKVDVKNTQQYKDKERAVKSEVLRSIYGYLSTGSTTLVVPTSTMIEKSNLDKLRTLEREVEDTLLHTYLYYFQTNPMLVAAVRSLGQDAERVRLCDILTASHAIFAQNTAASLTDITSLTAYQVVSALNLAMRRLVALAARSPGTLDFDYSSMTLREVKPSYLVQALNSVLTDEEKEFIESWHYPKLQAQLTQLQGGVSLNTGSTEADEWLKVAASGELPISVVPKPTQEKRFGEKKQAPKPELFDFSSLKSTSGTSGLGKTARQSFDVEIESSIIPRLIELVTEFSTRPVRVQQDAIDKIEATNNFMVVAAQFYGIKGDFESALDDLARLAASHDAKYYGKYTTAAANYDKQRDTIGEAKTALSKVQFRVDAAKKAKAVLEKLPDFGKAASVTAYNRVLDRTVDPLQEDTETAFNELQAALQNYQDAVKFYNTVMLDAERNTDQWVRVVIDTQRKYDTLIADATAVANELEVFADVDEYYKIDTDEQTYFEDSFASLRKYATTARDARNQLDQVFSTTTSNAKAVNDAFDATNEAVRKLVKESLDEKREAQDRYVRLKKEFDDSSALRQSFLEEYALAEKDVPTWIKTLYTTLTTADFRTIDYVALEELNQEISSNMQTFVYELQGLNHRLTVSPPGGAPISVIYYYTEAPKARATIIKDKGSFEQLVSKWAFGSARTKAMIEAETAAAEFMKTRQPPQQKVGLNTPVRPSTISDLGTSLPSTAAEIRAALATVAVSTKTESDMIAVLNWVESYVYAVRLDKELAMFVTEGPDRIAAVAEITLQLQAVDKFVFEQEVEDYESAVAAGLSGISATDLTIVSEYKRLDKLQKYLELVFRVRSDRSNVLSIMQGVAMKNLSTTQTAVTTYKMFVVNLMREYISYLRVRELLDSMEKIYTPWATARKEADREQMPQNVPVFAPTRRSTAASEVEKYLSTVDERRGYFAELVTGIVLAEKFSTGVTSNGIVKKWNALVADYYAYVAAVLKQVNVPAATDMLLYISDIETLMAEGRSVSITAIQLDNYRKNLTTFNRNVKSSLTTVTRIFDELAEPVGDYKKFSDSAVAAQALEARDEFIKFVGAVSDYFAIRDNLQAVIAAAKTQAAPPPEFPTKYAAFTPLPQRNDSEYVKQMLTTTARADVFKHIRSNLTTAQELVKDLATVRHVNKWNTVMPAYYTSVKTFIDAIPLANASSKQQYVTGIGVAQKQGFKLTIDPSKLDTSRFVATESNLSVLHRNLLSTLDNVAVNLSGSVATADQRRAAADAGAAFDAFTTPYLADLELMTELKREYDAAQAYMTTGKQGTSQGTSAPPSGGGAGTTLSTAAPPSSSNQADSSTSQTSKQPKISKPAAKTAAAATAQEVEQIIATTRLPSALSTSMAQAPADALAALKAAAPNVLKGGMQLEALRSFFRP